MSSRGMASFTWRTACIERFAPPNLAPLMGAAATGRIGQTLRRNTMITADYAGTAKFNLNQAVQSSTSIGG